MRAQRLLFLLPFLTPCVVRGADGPASDNGIEFFESKVRPVLVRHCYECHSTRSGNAESGLRVDSRDAIRAGGDRGPAVVPGDPQASWLITAVSHADPIKAAVAHALGLHLDLFQRIAVAPASVTVIAYRVEGPTVLAVNALADAGGLGLS